MATLFQNGHHSVKIKQGDMCIKTAKLRTKLSIFLIDNGDHFLKNAAILMHRL